MEDNKNIIYHYCSVGTFYSIISNKTIRLSDVSKTNEYMETQWAYKKILKEFSEKLLKDVFFTDRWKKIIENIYCKLPSLTLALVSSFSNEGDMLSQWIKYAKDGTGVAIGFDSNKLNFAQNDIGIFKEQVIYSENEQNRKIDEIVKKFLNEIDLSNKDDSDIESIVSDQIFSSLDNISSTMKNPAFKEEDEVRIVYPVNIGLESTLKFKENSFSQTRKICNTNFEISPIKYSVRDENLVLYSDLSFKDYIKNGIIKEIILGPKCKLNEAEIKYFLHSENYIGAVDIKKSEAAYN